MWYHVENGQRAGPLDDAELDRRIAEGRITAATLVWREGMADWAPAGTTELGPRFGAPPLPAGAPPVPALAPARPTSVTVFAILCMVFGGLALLCLPISLIGTFKISRELFPVPWFGAWAVISSVLGLAMAIWQVITGIGLLNLKRWGRRSAVAYGATAIVVGLVSLVMNVVMMTSGPIQSNPEMLPGMIGGTIGGLVGMAYPVLLIVFMRKPKAVEACVY